MKLLLIFEKGDFFSCEYFLNRRQNGFKNLKLRLITFLFLIQSSHFRIFFLCILDQQQKFYQEIHIPVEMMIENFLR